MTERDPDIYRALLENLSDGVMVIGFDGTVRIVNAALCKMFGLEADAVAGSRFGELFVAFEEFDEFTQIVLDAVADRSGSERRVTRVRIGDELRSLSVTTSYLTAEPAGVTERVALIAVVADITEVRELRETELRQAEVIERQLGELQGAYRDIEARNKELSATMKRLQAARGVAVLVVVALFLAVGAWYFRPLDLFDGLGARPGVEAGAVSTVTVEPREFRSTIALRGHLAPGRVVKVVSPFESHVGAVHAIPGQRVSEGDLLVDLSTGQLSADHRAAQVEHIRARGKLAELEDWENSAEMARARRALRRARLALDTTQRDVERAAFLLEEGLVPAAEHERAQQRHENRKLDFDAARRELDAVRAKGDDEARRIARLEADSAHGRLRAQEEKLDRATVAAPIAGIVLAADGPQAKPLAKGRPVAQGELLVSIADFERMTVTTFVDEVDVRKVEPGQRAWIAGPGFPGLRVEGTVSRVSSRAGPGLRRRNTPQFQILVALDRLEAEALDRLRVGMSAHVTIVVHHRRAALLVPLGAVEQVDGKAWVHVKNRGTATAQRRAVELGLTTLDAVEVVKGLSAGDTVVLPR